MRSPADDLLAELVGRGVRLWAEGDRIRYDGPRDTLTGELLGRIRAHRSDLLAALAAAPGSGPRPPGRIRLRPFTVAPSGPVVFLLPPAGTGPRVFDSWTAAAGPVELVAVHLPGREELLDEQPYAEAAPLADAIAAEVLAYGDRPRAVFGHSVGAVVGREVVKRLPPLAGGGAPRATGPARRRPRADRRRPARRDAGVRWRVERHRTGSRQPGSVPAGVPGRPRRLRVLPHRLDAG